MALWDDLFRRTKTDQASHPRKIGAPFVVSLDGQMYCDNTGGSMDLALEGEPEVLAAGRMVGHQGRVLEFTNESRAYKTSLQQMETLVVTLQSKGLDLKGDGKGVLVRVFDTFYPNGLGKTGVRYRVDTSGGKATLVVDDEQSG